MPGSAHQVLNVSDTFNRTHFWSPGIISHNSLGLGRTNKKIFSSEKFLSINNILRDSSLSIDIICLQETKTHPNQLLLPGRRTQPFGCEFKLVNHSASNTNSSDGVMIFARTNVKIIKTEPWVAGRVLYACLKNPDFQNKVHLVCIYGHVTTASGSNTMSNNLLEILNFKLNETQRRNSDNVIICGDFNFNIWSPPHSLVDSSVNLIQNFNLKDCFTKDETTWRGSGLRAGSTSRIDFILAKHTNNYNFSRLYSNVKSDHMVLVIAHKDKPPSGDKKIRYTEKILKNSYFKLSLHRNISKYLCEKTNKPFVDDLQTFISLDNASLYDHLPFNAASLLNKIISITKSTHDEYLKNNIKTQYLLEHEYQKSFNKICSKIDQLDDKSVAIEQLQKLKNDRKNEISTAKRRASELFANISAKENGKPTAHAFRPFKNKDDGKRIRALRVDGKDYTDTVNIVNIMTDLHVNKTKSILINEKEGSIANQSESASTLHNHIKDTLNSHDIELDEIFPKFPDVTRLAPVSTQEINDVIKSLKTISSPGPSGQTKQFYVVLMSLFPNIMTAIVNKLIHIEKFHDTPFSWIKKRNIIMLHKKKLIETDPSSYRPISLLECLYKIIAKLLSKQLSVHIEHIVHPDQFGFVRDRQMSVASHTVLALLQELNHREETACAVFLDIKSAFDLAMPSTLHFIMKYIFPNSNLPDLIHNLTSEGLANILIGGEHGKTFMLLFGFGQGDPLSSDRYIILHHLFVMFLHYAIERSRTNKIGVQLPGAINKNIPPIAFADDTFKCLKFQTPRDVVYWNKLLDDAESMTGLQVNKTKTKILVTGNARKRPQANLLAQEVGKVVDEVEHLGIVICLNPVDGRERTYFSLETKLSNSLKTFEKRAATTDIFHKKILVQALISSQMFHIFRVYPPTQKFIKQAWELIRSAIWKYTYDGKKHGRVKVAESRITAPIEKGGIGLTPPLTSAKTAYIGALRAIIVHTAEYPSSVLNYLFKLTPNKTKTIHEWGSKSILNSTKWLKRLIPLSEEMISMLSDTLSDMEGHPMHFYRSSVFGSRYSSDIYRNYALHPNLANVNTICELFVAEPIHAKPIIKDCYTNGNSMAKYFFTEMGKLLDKIEPTLLLPPWQLIREPNASIFRYFLKHDKKYITNALKSIQNEKVSIVCPPSYETRIRDKVDAPRSIKDFLKAYFFLAKASQIESKYRSFQFELLNRTLLSPNKAWKMKLNLLPSNLCSICPEQIVANTSHVVADCAIPTFFINIFNKFCKVKAELNKYELTPTRFEFGLPANKILNKEAEMQIQHLFFAVKHFAINAHFEERFNRWTKLIYFAKILNIVKTLSVVRKYAKCRFDIISCFQDFLVNNQYLIEE